MVRVGQKMLLVSGGDIDAVLFQQADDIGIAVEAARIQRDLISPEGQLIGRLLRKSVKLLQRCPLHLFHFTAFFLPAGQIQPDAMVFHLGDGLCAVKLDLRDEVQPVGIQLRDHRIPELQQSTGRLHSGLQFLPGSFRSLRPAHLCRLGDRVRQIMPADGVQIRLAGSPRGPQKLRGQHGIEQVFHLNILCQQKRKGRLGVVEHFHGGAFQYPFQKRFPLRENRKGVHCHHWALRNSKLDQPQPVPVRLRACSLDMNRHDLCGKQTVHTGHQLLRALNVSVFHGFPACLFKC